MPALRYLPMPLCLPYAISTILPPYATSLCPPEAMPTLQCAIWLRVCYSVSGTDLGHEGWQLTLTAEELYYSDPSLST
eukprot:2151108-Rhodomonas_salina.1